jgi:hypothetical protein
VHPCMYVYVPSADVVRATKYSSGYPAVLGYYLPLKCFMYLCGKISLSMCILCILYTLTAATSDLLYAMKKQNFEVEYSF